MNPRQPVLNPSVVSWRHCRRLVEAANGDIYLLRIRCREEGERSTTIWAERTQTPSPRQFSRLPGGEPEATPAERCPGHEGCATAATAI